MGSSNNELIILDIFIDQQARLSLANNSLNVGSNIGTYAFSNFEECLPKSEEGKE